MCVCVCVWAGGGEYFLDLSMSGPHARSTLKKHYFSFFFYQILKVAEEGDSGVIFFRNPKSSPGSSLDFRIPPK